MKFKLLKDLHTNDGIDTVVAYPQDTIISPNTEGIYEFTFMDKIKHYTKEELLKKTDMFIPIKDDIILDISEVEIDKDNEVKRYRIQLDVKTSLTKLKEIERFLKDNIPDYL